MRGTKPIRRKPGPAFAANYGHSGGLASSVGVPVPIPLSYKAASAIPDRLAICQSTRTEPCYEVFGQKLLDPDHSISRSYSTTLWGSLEVAEFDFQTEYHQLVVCLRSCVPR
ncbi:hypothetical protein R1flu_019936 [Riccia fluitans]|uniref:Uncharacterized protein n=1 Tax=Riccia fluitans TaxID=41844 RepID=A0ABD1ZK21_9MARC